MSDATHIIRGHSHEEESRELLIWLPRCRHKRLRMHAHSLSVKGNPQVPRRETGPLFFS